MANIQLTDALGLVLDAQPAPFSSLLKYFQQLPLMHLCSDVLSKAAGFTLDQPALTAFSSGISFDKGVTAGPGGTSISISSGAHGSLELIQRTPAVVSLPDVLAADVNIAPDTCFLAFGIDASAGAAIGSDSGNLQFGIGPNEAIEIRNYQSFPLSQKISLLDAVRETVSHFTIPFNFDDLSSLPPGCIATVTGTGSLKFSGTANLLTVTNPLASASLPAPLPAPSVTAGGSVQVGAKVELHSTYQICARNVAPGRVELGWYRESGSEFDITSAVSEGVDAGFGSTDLFASIIGAVSSSAAADLDQLQRAGLSSDEIASIQSAVKGAVSRKLEIALASEIGAADTASAMFLFEIDLGALSPSSREAIDQALHGDLSALHAGALPGIALSQSVWEKARSRHVQLTLNLLGILNFGSISTLATSGSVLVEPATGALIVTDKATAGRIRSTAVNFGADTEKLRHVMAESFLITAAYNGMQRQVGEPALSCSHDFFDLQQNTAPSRLARELRVGIALGLLTPAEAVPPAGIPDFGVTMVRAAVTYDAHTAETLFLAPGGQPLAREFYENMGRAAIQLLVSENDVDAVRRKPAIDDDLWNQMKSLGQPDFPGLFAGIAEPLVGAITADYSAIVWWADAMTGAGKTLAAVHDWFSQNPKASLGDPELQKLRQDLAGHLKEVASTTHEQFGEPWGLIAMDQASNRSANAEILVTGPKLVRSSKRAISAAARS